MCRLDELPNGDKPVIKLVGGLKPVALARRGDRVYAFDAFCPHGKWNLGASGVVVGDGRPYVVCTGHGGVWSLVDGRGTVQKKDAPCLKLYRVAIMNGEVYVDLS